MIKVITDKYELEKIVPILEEYSRSDTRAKLALDFETYNLQPPRRSGDDEEDEDLGIPRAIRRKDGSITGHIRLMQIGTDPNPSFIHSDHQYIIDVKAIGYQEVSRSLKWVLEHTTILGQNLKYEYQFAWIHLGIAIGKYAKEFQRENCLLDLMLMSQCLYAGDKVHHNLGDMYSRYLDFGWFKTKTGKTFTEYKQFKDAHQQADWAIDELTEDMVQYAADDVSLIFPLYDRIKEECLIWRNEREIHHLGRDKGLLKIIALECSLIPVFAFMELRGIKVDVKYQKNVVIKYLERKKSEALIQVGWTRTVEKKRSNGLRGAKREVWIEKVEEPLNLNSPMQLKARVNEMLADQVSAEVQIKTTGEEEFKELINRHKDLMSKEVIAKLRWILQYKKASSLLSKFGQKTLDLCTDRDYIHCSWFQIGTDEQTVSSGRSSCKNLNLMQQPSRGEFWVTLRDEKGKPIFKKDEEGVPVDGVNALEFFRTAFVAEDEWLFVDADYSAEEPRVAADFCQEANLISEFNKPGKVDVHSIIGKNMCGLDYYPKKGEYERDYIGKTAGLQLLYGAWWRSLKHFMYQKTDGKVDWTDDEAKNAYNTYFESFPDFRKKMDEVARDTKREAELKGTLAAFKKGRRPFAVAWTYAGRLRRFCIPKELMYVSDEELSRSYKRPKIDPETKEVVLNEDGEVVFTRNNIFSDKLSAACRESFNHNIQGTSADILKFALLDIEAEFEAAGFDWTEGVIAVIHDEVLVHVKKEHADIAQEIVVRCMKASFERFIKSVPCEVDCRQGKNWAQAKG